MTPVYLDYNATAPLRPEASRAIAESLDAGPGNPSSVHAAGRAARRRLEAARDAVAALAGAAPAQVVFTSGATEANALALARWTGSPGPRIASAVEHDSVRAWLDPAVGDCTIAVDGDGRVDPAALAALLADPAMAERGPPLVSVMAVNNETGVIQPVAEVAQVVRAAGGRLHVDAVQAAGRLDLAPLTAVADTLALSAHKLGGPAGVGALVVARDASLAPLLRGGAQEARRRAGTENLAGIAGFAAAATAAAEIGQQARLSALRDRLEAACLAEAPGLVVAGDGAPRVANTSALSMPGVAAETQVMAFDLDGIAVGAGAACTSGKVGPSHVLAAMGLPAAVGETIIRVSLGWTSTDADIDRFVAAWCRLHRRHVDRRPAA